MAIPKRQVLMGHLTKSKQSQNYVEFLQVKLFHYWAYCQSHQCPCTCFSSSSFSSPHSGAPRRWLLQFKSIINHQPHHSNTNKNDIKHNDSMIGLPSNSIVDCFKWLILSDSLFVGWPGKVWWMNSRMLISSVGWMEKFVNQITTLRCCVKCWVYVKSMCLCIRTSTSCT